MIDQIPAAATVVLSGGSPASQTASIAGVNVAVAFTDQQVVQYFSTALPSDVVVTDYIVVAGATYGAGNSILGIKAWDVNSNTGTIGGLNRNGYSGPLRTPTIELGR